MTCISSFFWLNIVNQLQEESKFDNQDKQKF